MAKSAEIDVNRRHFLFNYHSHSWHLINLFISFFLILIIKVDFNISYWAIWFNWSCLIAIIRPTICFLLCLCWNITKVSKVILLNALNFRDLYSRRLRAFWFD